MFNLIIADDEPRIRRGLRNCIDWTSLDVEVSGEAENGKQALSMIIKQQAQLLITDIRMPEMDGLELIEAIYSLKLNISVAIISGYSDFSYAQQAIRFGVTDYLLKPIEEDELIACIRRQIIRLESKTLETEEKDLSQRKATRNNRLVQHALDFIRENYTNDISLGDVAAAISVHPNYLSNLFSKICGVRFSEYLCRLRIEKAKELMCEPHFKVYEVADMVGYNDYRWFSKLFKQIEGVTPKEFKNNLE